MGCCTEWTASSLRKAIVSFIESHPTLDIKDSPLKDWVEWETAASVADYCSKMRSHGEWGGAIEMAVLTHMLPVSVYVYEREGSAAFRRCYAFQNACGGAAGASAGNGLYRGRGKEVSTLAPSQRTTHTRMQPAGCPPRCHSSFSQAC